MYHILLTLIHTRLIDDQRVRSDLHTYVGFALHLSFVVRFVMYLHNLNTFNSVYALLMA
jgi:hypothetical protein